ncbi:MAG: ferric reductase-like transmembrane domain-containing protein, partial [Gillisia sp.]
MKYNYRSAFLWLLVFFLLSLIPLAIAISGNIPEYRGFWIEMAVALGFLGLAIFGLQFIFSGRFANIAPTFGMDNILHFHRGMGIVAVVFILAHPVILILANPKFSEFFDPRVNFLRAIALSFAGVALLVIITTSLWRKIFKLNYEKWRLIHGFLALSLVFIGVVHSIQVGHYLDALWKKGLLALLMGIPMYIVIHTRIVRPWRMKKKPYKIVEVKKERNNCWTIGLEPIGHKRKQFTAGQFFWISINETPFTLQQNPFTVASGEEDEKLSFTAKEVGDFTSKWGDFKPGTNAFLEGPFGSFTPVAGKHFFLVMGGIGVTPAMSMLRTMRETNDARRAVLIYANNDWENVTFREELEGIKNQIDLEIIHILMEPPEDWEGEKGMIDQEFLQ